MLHNDTLHDAKQKTDEESRRLQAKETVHTLYALPYPTSPCEELKQCFRTPLLAKLNERTDKLEQWAQSVRGIILAYDEAID